jgi:hypothetical protein
MQLSVVIRMMMQCSMVEEELATAMMTPMMMPVENMCTRAYEWHSPAKLVGTFAGSRRVLATAVDNWSGKPYCVSS